MTGFYPLEIKNVTNFAAKTLKYAEENLTEKLLNMETMFYDLFYQQGKNACGAILVAVLIKIDHVFLTMTLLITDIHLISTIHPYLIFYQADSIINFL